MNSLIYREYKLYLALTQRFLPNVLSKSGSSLSTAKRKSVNFNFDVSHKDRPSTTKFSLPPVAKITQLTRSNTFPEFDKKFYDFYDDLSEPGRESVLEFRNIRDDESIIAVIERASTGSPNLLNSLIDTYLSNVNTTFLLYIVLMLYTGILYQVPLVANPFGGIKEKYRNILRKLNLDILLLKFCFKKI